jgi:UDP-N-acetylglucosamine 4-epimerase
MKIFNDKLYNTPFHPENLSNYRFLVTGGAGFIGSNLVEYLLKFGAGHVRVLDNLSNGYFENISGFIGMPNFEFIEGDIRNIDTCRLAVQDIDFISHQAALGSVPRSIEDPILSNNVNIDGFLNIMVAAKESIILKQMVYAASSSTYGDSTMLPKIEGNEGNPLSPYAVTKLVNELYADVFYKVYRFNSIGLRYFNVFGPKQNPDNPYAAVIPKFCKHFLNDTELVINGDGNTSRDFTFVENAIQANIRALFVGCSNNEVIESSNKHLVFNVACGEQYSLNQLVLILQDISEKSANIYYAPERKGDVKHSLASIEKLTKFCNYKPNIKFRQGLEIAYNWYSEKNTLNK